MKTPLVLACLAALIGAASPVPGAQPQEKKELRVLRTHGLNAPALKPSTYLGVEVRRAGPTLAEQLGLPAGVGLVVRSIVPDSPAAALLKPHDVVTKLNDQLLIESRQLSVLVRSFKEGDEVTLTYFRAGKEATGRVKLAKRDLPEPPELSLRGGDEDHLIRIPEDAPQMRELAPLLHEDGAFRPRVRVFRPGEAGGTAATGLNPANSHLLFSDEKGSLSLTLKDGSKVLVAKDPKGATLFDGPVDTPDQREKLPADVRQRFEQMERFDHVTFEARGEAPRAPVGPGAAL